MPVLSDAPNERNTMHDTDVIAAHWPIFSGINGTRCACGWRESMPIEDLSDHAAKIWAAHVEAELVRASTVTTEAELRELPEGTIIRAEVHREMPSGRKHVIARIYEKHDMRRNEWLDLDPGDRNDGDETVPAALVMNYYGTAGATVLFRPEVTP